MWIGEGNEALQQKKGLSEESVAERGSSSVMSFDLKREVKRN